MRILEIVSVAFALAYLVLAIRQRLWCWPAALVSVALATVVFYDAKLYMESALQLYYFAMAIYGWRQWQSGGSDHAGVRVHWWRPEQHALTIAGILATSAGLAWVLGRTDAAFPFLDSLTTVAAIVTTYMVAQKVIENWIYWFAIDAILVYLYLDRGLEWYAGLYALYLVMVVIGFRRWWLDRYVAGRAASDPGGEDRFGPGRTGG